MMPNKIDFTVTNIKDNYIEQWMPNKSQVLGFK